MNKDNRSAKLYLEHLLVEGDKYQTKLEELKDKEAEILSIQDSLRSILKPFTQVDRRYDLDDPYKAIPDYRDMDDYDLKDAIDDAFDFYDDCVYKFDKIADDAKEVLSGISSILETLRQT